MNRHNHVVANVNSDMSPTSTRLYECCSEEHVCVGDMLFKTTFISPFRKRHVGDDICTNSMTVDDMTFCVLLKCHARIVD